MLTLHPLPAFQDNYFWLLHSHQHAWVVDPGDAAPVLAYLAAHQLQLAGILITHHHADHTGGVEALREACGPEVQVFGPAFETLPEASGPIHRVSAGQTVGVLGQSFTVLAVPGHTAGHIAYYCPEVAASGSSAPVLFCGDTLFSGGCGRIFEGTPAQMLASLDQLAALPAATRVCCAHEYTLGNLRFAQAVEPASQELAQYVAHCQALRQQNLPTVPAQLGTELRINPFLRSRTPSVAAAVRQRAPQAHTEAEVFGALREWKNSF